MKKLHPTWSHTEAMKALSRAFISENPDSTLDTKIIPRQCLMELVTPNEASTINEAFERMEKSDVRYRFVIDMASLSEAG